MKKTNLFISFIMLLALSVVSCNGGFGQKEPQFTDFTYEIPQDLIDAVCRADMPLNYTVTVKLYNSNETGNILGQGSTTFNNEDKSCEPIVIPAVPLNTPFTAYVTIVESVGGNVENGSIICEGISRGNELTESNKTVTVKLSVTNESDYLHVGYKVTSVDGDSTESLIYGTVENMGDILSASSEVEYGGMLDYCIDGDNKWVLYVGEDGEVLNVTDLSSPSPLSISSDDFDAKKIAYDPLDNAGGFYLLGSKEVDTGEDTETKYYIGVYNSSNGDIDFKTDISSLCTTPKTGYRKEITDFYIYNKKPFFATVEYKPLFEDSYMPDCETAELCLYYGLDDSSPVNLMEAIPGLSGKYAEVVDMQYQAGHLYVLIGYMMDNFSTAYETGYLVECSVVEGNHLRIDRYLNYVKTESFYTTTPKKEYGDLYLIQKPDSSYGLSYASFLGKCITSDTVYDDNLYTHAVNVVQEGVGEVQIKYIAPSVSNQYTMANPVKFVATKPGSLFFADFYRKVIEGGADGIEIQCESRIVQVDLVSFTIRQLTIVPNDMNGYNFNNLYSIYAYANGCYYHESPYYAYKYEEAALNNEISINNIPSDE